MKVVRLAIVTALLSHSGVLVGQEVVTKEPFKVFDKKSRDPVEITSESLSADLSNNKIMFRGQVVARQGQRVIYADNMEAAYEKGGEIKSLYAYGHVKMTGENSFATGEKLVWDNDKQTVRLWENPRVIQGRQLIRGEEMIFYMSEDRLDITKPQIEWLPEEKRGGRKK